MVTVKKDDGPDVATWYKAVHARH